MLARHGVSFGISGRCALSYTPNYPQLWNVHRWLRNDGNRTRLWILLFGIVIYNVWIQTVIIRESARTGLFWPPHRILFSALLLWCALWYIDTKSSGRSAWNLVFVTYVVFLFLVSPEMSTWGRE